MDDATSQSEAEAELEPGWVRWRQKFHRFPETGCNGRQTADSVAMVLQMLGLEMHRGIGGTGVVAGVTVGGGKGVFGVRADMDALAMTETAESRPFASTNPGCMHARGGHAVRPRTAIGPSSLE